MKETGYPVSMEDVKLSAVEVEYYMNEEHNEYSSPVVYDQPEQLRRTEKGSEMLPDGAILGKKGS